MKNTKRLLSAILALAIICTLLPADALSVFAAENVETEVAAQETTGSYVQKENDMPEEIPQKGSAEMPTQEDYAQADLVFEQIDAIKESNAKKKTDQTQLTDAAIEIVLSSDSYAEGSLERSGDAFSWWTEGGIRCMYDPRMQEIQENTTPGKGINEVVNEPMATKAAPTGKDVYLIGPYYGYDSDFSNQYKNEASEIATAIGDTNGYTLYSGTAATVDRVAQAISNGGVVIFDSHGTTDYAKGDDYVTGATSSYLCLTTTTGLTSADYNAGAGYLSGGGAAVNGATIANHMTKNSPGGILWMAICLGMATDGLCKPMRQKGVEVVYGYSQSVTFGGDYCFEETFWDEMKKGCTVAQSIATMKSAYGNWDYSYEIAKANGWGSSYASTIASARSNYCAFPIVVSDQDTHPGQRTASQYASSGFFGADSLQTVQSTYKLFESGSDDVYVFTWGVSNGVFTVTGDGDMPNYASASAYPWYEYRNSITSVVIGDGVTAVADYAFSGYPYLQQVDLGKTVKTVGVESFYDCSSLRELYAPGTLTTIKTYGLSGCYSIQNLYFGGSASGWSSLSYRPSPNRMHYNVSSMSGHWTQKTVQATCTTDGYTYELCSCGYEQNKVITQTAVDHNYRQIVVAPTCTAGGYTQYTCTACGYSYTNNAVSAAGHSYRQTVVAPTCTQQGYTTHTCHCGDTYVDAYVDATGHTHVSTVVKPTPSAQGYTQHTCHCGDSYKDTYVAALDMSVPKVTITVDAAIGQPVLSWANGGEGVTYEIYRATKKTGTYAYVATVAIPNWSDASAAVGKTYYYKVKAIYAEDTSFNSDFSVVVSATAKCATPELMVSNNSSGKPVVTWNKVNGAKKYTVYVATSQNGTYKKLGTTTKLSYTDSKAKAGTTYFYKVVANASKSAYDSGYSNIVSCGVICGTPSVTVKVDANTGKPSLSWKKVDGATKYAIYRDGELLTTTTAVTYADTGAAIDTQYTYTVQALGKTEDLNGNLSKAVTATSGIAKPTVKGSLTALGQPQLSWNAVEGAVKYEIYRSTKSSKGYALVGTAEELTYTDKSASVGKTYYYQVKAVGEVSKSANSSYVKLTGKCATPQISVENNDSGKPYITWEKVSGAKKYTVYVATSQNGTYKKLGTSTKTYYTDTKAKAGTTYFYKVIANASSSKYNSGYSNIVSCGVKCATPVVKISNNASGAPVISWSKVTGAVKYKVMYMDATDYLGSAAGPYADFEEHHTEAYATGTSFTIPNAESGRFYMVSVVAVAADGNFSSEGAEPVFADAIPATPKLTGKVGANKKPVLSWAEVEGAYSYVIYRSTSKSKGYKVIDETESLTYEDLTAAKGKTYYYKIVAVGNGVESAQSSYVKVKSK